MRKGLTLILMALAIMIIAVSCDEPQVHVHTYSEEWESDATSHWHKATCEHTEEVSEKAEHTWGDWIRDKEPTETEKGSKHRVCDVCKREQTADIPELNHTHTLISGYSSNGEYHWQTCTGCDEEINKTRHSNAWVSNSDLKHVYKCTVCGYRGKEESHVFGTTTYSSGKKVQFCEVCDYTKSLTAVETKTEKVTSVEKVNSTATGTTAITVVNKDGTITTKDVDNSKLVKNTAPVTIETEVVATETSTTSEQKTKVSFPSGALKMEENATDITLTVKAVPAVEATSSDSGYQGENTKTGTSSTVAVKTSQAVVAGFEFTLTGANTTDLSGTAANTGTTVETYIAPGLGDKSNLNIVYVGTVTETEGNKPEVIKYNTSNGYLEFTVYHFSKYAVIADNIVATDTKGKMYGTLQEAVSGVAEGGTVTILKDITLTSYVNVGSSENRQKTLTINLNGKTVKGEFAEGVENKAKSLFRVCNAKLTLAGTGTIVDPYYGGVFLSGSKNEADIDYTVLTVEKGIKFTDDCAIMINENIVNSGNYDNHGIVVNFYGTAEVSKYCALYVNGKNIAQKNAPVFNIKDATITSTYDENDDDTAIYAAGYAVWNIENSTITGVDSAIEIRAGELNITSGTFKATTTNEYTSVNKPANTTTTGAALAVAQHTTKLPIKVTISGGTFIVGENGRQIAIVDPQVNGAQYTKNVIVKIKAACNLSKDKIVGKYTLKKSEAVVDTYSVDAQSLILAGYGYKFDPNKDGAKLVTISNTGSDEILYIGPTVGSTGTETNGYQLLKGTNVKFQDVSIKYGDGAKIGFQKYNDLTLEDVTLDASECSTMGYVVSNNNGTTKITGSTVIKAADEKVALDVYYWPNNSKGTKKYPEGVSVVFDSNFKGSVSGIIEFAVDNNAKTTPKTNNGKHSLVIEAGNFSKATLKVCSFVDGSEIKIKKTVWDVSTTTLPTGYEWKENDGYLTVVTSKGSTD